MKRFLLSLSAFLAVTISFYCGFLCLLGEFPGAGNLIFRLGQRGHTHSRLRDAGRPHDVDVLFIGGSKCFRGFDPRIFAEAGISSFNLGTSAQTFRQTNLLLRRSLHQYNPRLVIIEAAPRALSREGLESTLDLATNAPFQLDLLPLTWDVNHAVAYNTLLYSALRQAFSLDRDFIQPATNDRDRYVAGTGFVETLVERRTEFTPAHYGDLTPDPAQISALDDALLFLRERDVGVLLVQAPIPTQDPEILKSIEEHQQVFRERGEFVEGNQLDSFHPEKHFYDDVHLNRSGVARFNAGVIRFLETRRP